MSMNCHLWAVNRIINVGHLKAKAEERPKSLGGKRRGFHPNEMDYLLWKHGWGSVHLAVNPTIGYSDSLTYPVEHKWELTAPAIVYTESHCYFYDGKFHDAKGTYSQVRYIRVQLLQRLARNSSLEE